MSRRIFLLSLVCLLNLGVSPYVISNSLIGTLSQRLARRVCPRCAVRYTPEPQLLEMLGLEPTEASNFRFARGEGCADCIGTGYRGRIGIFEIMRANDGFRRLLLQGAPKRELQEQAMNDGMLTMAASGLEKIAEGLTTPEELFKNVV